jgi:hypothetical protein
MVSMRKFVVGLALFSASAIAKPTHTAPMEIEKRQIGLPGIPNLGALLALIAAVPCLVLDGLLGELTCILGNLTNPTGLPACVTGLTAAELVSLYDSININQGCC